MLQNAQAIFQSRFGRRNIDHSAKGQDAKHRSKYENQKDPIKPGRSRRGGRERDYYLIQPAPIAAGEKKRGKDGREKDNEVGCAEKQQSGRQALKNDIAHLSRSRVACEPLRSS